MEHQAQRICAKEKQTNTTVGHASVTYTTARSKGRVSMGQLLHGHNF